MSFILDALRRAERERNLGRAPRLEDVALAGPSMRRPPRPARWLLLALAALLAISLLLFLALRPRPAAVAPAATPAVQPALSAPHEPPAPAPVANPLDNAPPAVAGDQALMTLDDLADHGAVPPAQPEVPGEFAEAEPLPVPGPPAELAEAEPPLAEPERPAEAQSDIPVEPEAVEASVSRLQLSQPAPPRLQDMPPAYRADFPALSLDVHVWDEDPARRFVLVAGRRYREGETLAQGPRLVEIAPDGVILEYQGSRVLFALQR